MMEGKSHTQKETKEHKQTGGTFQIKVKNKFDSPTELRSIRVRHSSAPAYVVLPAKKRKCSDPERQATEDWPKLEYELNPNESLVIELDNEAGKFTNDVYIELPYIADYEFYWEVRKDDKKKELARPITKIKRDTTPHNPKEKKLIEEAKTFIVIPADQTSWKLEIKSPRNNKEHYRPKELLEEYLLPTNGESDDVSVGDNGSG